MHNRGDAFNSNVDITEAPPGPGRSHRRLEAIQSVRIEGKILYEYEKSDRLLMFLLENLAPDKYKRRVEKAMVWDGRLDSIPEEQLPTVIDNLMRQAFGDDPEKLEAGRRQVMLEAGVQIVNGEFVEIERPGILAAPGPVKLN